MEIPSTIVEYLRVVSDHQCLPCCQPNVIRAVAESVVTCWMSDCCLVERHTSIGQY